MAADDWQLLSQPAEIVAPRLLGCWLERSIQGQVLRVKIVETEAYDQSDVASHSYKGETPRTTVMFGPAGHLYVYFTYGMHYCCNVVTGPIGHGSAVLIRAVEPLNGAAAMSQARHGLTGVQLTNGPAKLCQALEINHVLNGHDLQAEPLRLKLQPAVPQTAVTQTTRIGISRGQEVPWRFYLAGNPFVSRT
jgi:DNA-3-methyladenine glycosylase